MSTPSSVPTVAVIAYDAVNPFELAVATEVFGFERPELGVLWYRFLVCGVEPRPIQTSVGLWLTTPHTLADLAAADIIIVPSSRPGVVPVPDNLLSALRAAHERGARIAAFCTGSFILAAAGLLDGRRATTHWLWTADLQARYPHVRVDPDVLYVDEGQVLTSAGTAAAIDLSLHIVRQDYGAAIAAAVARRMVVPPQRDGGQAQFIEAPLLPVPGDEPFSATLEWMMAHLREDLSVARMAARSHVSERTYSRRFRETLGTTPHQWIVRQRIALAQRLLETTGEPIERVAVLSGFATAAALRVHFHRLVRTSPLAYRHTFRHVQPGAAAVAVASRRGRPDGANSVTHRTATTPIT